MYEHQLVYKFNQRIIVIIANMIKKLKIKGNTLSINNLISKIKKEE